MDFNEKDGAYCKFDNGAGYGNVSATWSFCDIFQIFALTTVLPCPGSIGLPKSLLPNLLTKKLTYSRTETIYTPW